MTSNFRQDLQHSALGAAIDWIDAAIAPLQVQVVPLAAAFGRVLAEDIPAAAPLPPVDRAAIDGFAVRAEATFGASSYNPLQLPLLAVAAGEAMPAGMDAVIPTGLAQLHGGDVECVDAVAPGDNVEVQGAIATPGTILTKSGTQLAARHIGLLTHAEVSCVSAVRLPRVRIVVASPAPATDSNGPMVRAATERDGGVIVAVVTVERGRVEIGSALDHHDADIIVVIGGTGAGCNDHAPAALAEIGDLVIQGIALRPGETCGLGRTARGVPVVLLPGWPAACLFGYELLAGRAIRRLGGRAAALPYRSQLMIAARKIVSAIGLTEICPVRVCAENAVEPLPSFAETGLMAAVAGDGFVIVAEASEGYAQGEQVLVYLYDGCLYEDASPAKAQP